MNVQIFKADFIVWLKIACSLHHLAIWRTAKSWIIKKHVKLFSKSRWVPMSLRIPGNHLDCRFRCRSLNCLALTSCRIVTLGDNRRCYHVGTNTYFKNCTDIKSVFWANEKHPDLKVTLCRLLATSLHCPLYPWDHGIAEAKLEAALNITNSSWELQIPFCIWDLNSPLCKTEVRVLD